MVRLGGMLCAAGLVCLALVGCDNLRNFDLKASAFLASGGGGDRVVAGSLDTVASSTEDTLRQAGLSVLSTREGDAVRLKVTTKTGQHFSLVLTRQKSETGDLTRLRFVWDDARDENVESQVLSQIEVQAKR